jgi:hypothetical protein
VAVDAGCGVSVGLVSVAVKGAVGGVSVGSGTTVDVGAVVLVGEGSAVDVGDWFSFVHATSVLLAAKATSFNISRRFIFLFIKTVLY